MLKNVDSVISGITKWYSKEISGLDWKLTLATPFIGNIIKNYINKNQDLVTMALDENGMIDVDVLKEQYKALLDNSGRTYLEIMNVKINKNDIDNLAEYIKRE